MTWNHPLSIIVLVMIEVIPGNKLSVTEKTRKTINASISVCWIIITMIVMISGEKSNKIMKREKKKDCDQEDRVREKQKKEKTDWFA